MDTLNLSGIFSRLRNPQGMRRWAHWAQTTPKANPAAGRITQQLLVAGQNHAGGTGLPPAVFIPDIPDMYQTLTQQDLWVRPADRWFLVNVVNTGTVVEITAVLGNQFVVEDPVDALTNPNPFRIAAQPGEDITITTSTATHKLKVVSVLAANRIIAVAPTGQTLPATQSNAWARHRLDAYFIELTSTSLIRDIYVSPAPGMPGPIVRPKIRLVYYTSTTPINQDYEATYIRALNSSWTTPTYAGAYKQVMQLFQIVVARVPDEIKYGLEQKWLVNGDVAHPALYCGNLIGEVLPVENDLTQAPQAIQVNQTEHPPVDVMDAYTSVGDLVMVQAGQECPPGFENIAQVDSLYNEHFVQNRSTDRADMFSLTVTYTGTSTTFAGTLTKHPAEAAHPLANPANNSSTYEMLAIRNGKRFAQRIPKIVFASNGTFSFALSGDLRWLINVGPNICQAYLFQGGIFRRTVLTEANQYEKPFVTDEDIQLVQWSSADGDRQGLLAANPNDDGKCWLDRVMVANTELFSVGDTVKFTGWNGEPIGTVPQNRFLSSATSRNLVALQGNYGVTYGGTVEPEFRVVRVDSAGGFLILAAIDATAADVDGSGNVAAAKAVDLTGYILAYDDVNTVSYDTSPPTYALNEYQITRSSIEHTHLVSPSEDQSTKYYNKDGMYVSKSSHYHEITAVAVLPPYTKMIVCARL